MASAIPVLYRDEHLAVVDKPPGMLVVHAPGRRGPTVIDALTEQLGRSVLPVHRLDAETSGALLVALTRETRTALETMFRAHEIERLYLALVSRVPSPPAGRIESLLQERGNTVRTVLRGGKTAITHYRTLERRAGGALVLCRLETGRRNQIRVHLADLGCPLVGDRKYGYRSSRRAGRVMLHSWRLRLRHPASGEELSVEAVAPESELRFEGVVDCG